MCGPVARCVVLAARGSASEAAAAEDSWRSVRESVDTDWRIMDNSEHMHKLTSSDDACGSGAQRCANGTVGSIEWTSFCECVNLLCGECVLRVCESFVWCE